MRVVLLFVLGLLVGGCTSQPRVPSKADSVAELQSETVALVRLSLKISIKGEKLNVSPITRPFCSGVWVSSSSILTAAHCVDDLEIGGELAYVVRADVFEGDTARELMKPRIGKLVALDAAHDLALIRALVPIAHEVAAVSIGPVEAGMTAQTMGHPRALWWSYSSGEVSAIRKAYMPTDPSDLIGEDVLWIQTTAPISPGNSGGGLFDAYGHLIGIASRSRSDGQMLNFYIHRDHIAAFISKQATL